LNTKLLLATCTVALVWGTTFLGIKIAVETVPPWFVAGIRQFLAACILLMLLVFQGKFKWIGWKELQKQLILSSIMLIGANGLTTVAEDTLSSSLASLLTALAPVFIFIGSLLIGMQRFSVQSLIGVILGFSGVVFIFWDGLSELSDPSYRWGIITMLVAISCWATGTIYSKKQSKSPNPIELNLVYQFFFAGIVQLIFAFSLTDHYHFEQWSIRSVSAILYLAVFGSLITFFAFHYVLKFLLPTQVSMLSYVNTIIAIILGWLILDENISFKFGIATALIIGGVFIMNYKPGMFNKKSIN